MRQINVISDVYKNIAVNFNGLIVNFDVEGKGIISFDEKQTELVDKIFEIHPNIYKGDKLPIKEKLENSVVESAIKEKDTIIVEFEHLKESNKNLALENASLKKENASLKEEKEELENKICTLMQASKKPLEEKTENIEEKSVEESTIKEDLNKKTIAQLKEILNTEDFLPFKEEWKDLTKKEDIVNYILKKVEEN